MQNFSKVIQILNVWLFSDICLESFTILNNPDILKVKKISFESYHIILYNTILHWKHI